ncbi:MAG: bacteriohopanetetrol glucosamine biosynthesis glycosyltransferase HpnI [Acidobacteria bacterium]|nr:bacteriohopanetetrol glucosamine biosynthesis glycosyltransferase HpnI [Acidobacteriota bacterium]
MTRAMKRIGEVHVFSPRALLDVVVRAFRVGWMWLGILLMALSFYAFLALLSWNPVSFVIPALALNYAVGALGAKYLLREHVSGTRWVGVLLVCSGVTLVCAGERDVHLSAAVALPALRDVVLILACSPFIYYLLSIFSACRFFSEKRSEAARVGGTNEFVPPVSILKPVRGLDPETYENFASFCRLDYPEYELLFCVNEPDDPAVPLIENLIREFPERPISLLVGANRLGSNGKVNKLCRLAREARHNLLVISDSDIRVGPDYLRAVVAPFRDPKVGAVTCMFIGLAERQLGAELEAVGAASDFFAGVLVARQLEGMKFAMGSTVATTRLHLEEIGGLESLADQHSDDFELGRRIAACGQQVDLSGYTVWTMYPAQTVRTYFEHQLRQARTTRECRPWGYCGLLLTFGLPWSLAAAMVAPSVSLAAGYLGTYLVLRFLMAWTVGVWGLKDPVLRRKLWLVPVRDALAFLVWIASFFSSRIKWRGLEFTIENGRMVSVAPRGMAAPAAEISATPSDLTTR